MTLPQDAIPISELKKKMPSDAIKLGVSKIGKPYLTAPDPTSNVNIPLETAKGTLKTIGRSAGRAAKSLGSAVIHPAQTIKGLVDMSTSLSPIRMAYRAMTGARDKTGLENLINHYQNKYEGLGNAATYYSPIRIVKRGITGKDDGVQGNDIPNFAKTISEDPFAFLSDLGMIYGGLKTLKQPVATAKALQKAGQKVGRGVKYVAKTPSRTISKVRDYAGNKTNAIKAGAKKYWKNEVRAYGKTLDTLSDNPNKVVLNDLMESSTQMMVNRRLYDPINQKWVKPLNSVDSQLVKSYTTLSRDYLKQGHTKLGTVVREYQKIRDSAKINTPLGRDARITANKFLESIKSQIDIPAFKDANLRYGNFRDNFNAIDKKVNVWGSSLETGKGERFLTRGLGVTKEARTTAKTIEQTTGQSLKAAKVLSAIRNLPAMKWVIR